MRIIVAFFGIAILAVGATVALNSALIGAGEDTTIVNETWTPSAGSVTQLDDSELTGAFYRNDTTVYNSSDLEMARGTDYEWIQKNGTVKALVGGDLDGEPSANITYSYDLTTKEQRDFADLMGLIPRAVGYLLPFFAFIALVIIARGG